MALFHSFEWLNSIPFYMYHIFFIHSPVHEHLGCFQVLAIVNSVAVNMGVHVSFELELSSDVYPGVGFLDHTVTLFLLFEEPPSRSTVAAPIYLLYILTSREGGAGHCLFFF